MQVYECNDWIARHLKHVIGVEDLRFSIVGKSVAEWEHVFPSEISDGKALHAPLHEIGSNPPAVQVCLSNAFAILPIRTLHFFSTVIHDRVYEPGGIAPLDRSCAVAEM